MNAYQLDGLRQYFYAESYRGLSMQAMQPPIDALQEFKIQNQRLRCGVRTQRGSGGQRG